MLTAVSVITFALLYCALLVFYWRMLRAGGRWGQRPSADRALPLGGMLFFGGLLLGIPAVATHNSVLGGTALLCFITGEALILLGPRLFQRLDEGRSQSIRHGLDLDNQ